MPLSAVGGFFFFYSNLMPFKFALEAFWTLNLIACFLNLHFLNINFISVFY
ncbi:hypothetical protein [Campylobacter showae]|uniref:hypothetical protein n=1 Tax=Campylobacter showae TaxID=204 RepID=UPI0013D0605B|nr:hypothetical protein [Campylobacter showae]